MSTDDKRKEPKYLYKTTDFKNECIFNLVAPPGLELIFTFKLALTLDTS